jgi:hypothetical protein
LCEPKRLKNENRLTEAHGAYQTMDENYFRQKAAMCLRLAKGLSLDNPGRYELLNLAEDFNRRAQQLAGGKMLRNEMDGSHE